MARQPLAITRAGPHDRQQADRGGGQHVIERLRRDDPCPARQGCGGQEPARQRQQQHRGSSDQRGARSRLSQTAALLATFGGDQRAQGHAAGPR
ncbi:hypothetical protein WR25_14054 [Diploscapter pachys]|uniref:Uncharacterized protein n=1 Tax=Diploscapter pachys TaxID=2018661 RepID=A0A2A2KA28_9BILA|nr:hypothetical protein WR25_14054 [Diploscapter pachys]